MTYRIAICDDEQNQIEYLTSVVSAWSKENGHICEICTFPSAEAFLFAYEDTAPTPQADDVQNFCRIQDMLRCWSNTI